MAQEGCIKGTVAFSPGDKNLRGALDLVLTPFLSDKRDAGETRTSEMTEEKVLIPAYKRSGSCARCGADVYSPDLKQNGGWPLMSACVCEHGPQMAHEAKTKDLRESREARPEEQAQAA
jgi:hypothetical protein